MSIVAELGKHGDCLVGVQFNYAGNRLVSTSGEKFCRVWAADGEGDATQVADPDKDKGLVKEIRVCEFFYEL
jgi:hypothetical protein